MENQFIIFVLVRFIRIFSCIKYQLLKKPRWVPLALKRNILSGWDGRSNSYVSNSLLLGFEVWVRPSSSYLPGQSSIISSCSGAPGRILFLKIHEDSRPGGASLKCFQLEDHLGRQEPCPNSCYCNHSPSSSTTAVLLQLLAKLMLLLGISRSWYVVFISIRKLVTYARNWSFGSVQL